MKIVIWKIGNEAYPATQKDIKKFKKLLKKLRKKMKKSKGKKRYNIVTPHTVTTEIIKQ